MRSFVIFISLQVSLCFSFFQFCKAQDSKDVVSEVNPFIGTTNYGTTNPGAIVPWGLMSVCPFNVMGSDMNRHDKDKGWWSTPYSADNKFFTGFSHVNLSGVGCPEMGSLLLMPTTGKLDVDYHNYGSEYINQTASPGYYSNVLTKYNIKTEVTASKRVGISRFTFPKGECNIILNLGEGLTNETGAWAKRISDNEYVGCKLLGSFCYTESQAVFPIYFAIKVDRNDVKSGFWKYMRRGEKWENEWNKEAGTYKIYDSYAKDMAGDNMGLYFSFDNICDDSQVSVGVAVSFVSVENALQNLQKEYGDFDSVYDNAKKSWEKVLSLVSIEGGSEDERFVFYTGLYHSLIHPNILNDNNGEYPNMESPTIGCSDGNQYTVFSLWDTYRNLHPLISLLYPKVQRDMVSSMLRMYKSGGWLPKWELYGRESLTMEGDPASIVVADTWLRGIRDFDTNTALEAMKKSALTLENNKLRPENAEYVKLGFVPMTSQYDNSVSHALEYYLSDWCISKFATAMGDVAFASKMYKQALGYKNYFDKTYGMLRPKMADGSFYSPFIPEQGMNFNPSPGFHEGCAWNYTFAVPHDLMGLKKLMGGSSKFVATLQKVFDNGCFDVTNEPDINYPHFFSLIKGQEWRTQEIVSDILEKHFKNEAGGLPGNDDTGTMSAWAVFNMLGFYPYCPGCMDYVLTVPVFDRTVIKLDTDYYSTSELVIRKVKLSKSNGREHISSVVVDGVKLSGCTISHQQLTSAHEIIYYID